MGQAPSVKEAQVVADEIFSDFVSQEVDKVEIIYTKFVSLIASGASLGPWRDAQAPRPGG